MTWERWAWPRHRLGEGLVALARHAGLPLAAERATPRPPPTLSDDEGSLRRWVESSASWLGLEAEPVEVSLGELEALLRHGGPALLRPPGGEGFLLLLRARRRRALLLAPDLTLQTLTLGAVRDALQEPIAAPRRSPLEALLAATGVPPSRRARAGRAYLAELLAATPLEAGWLLRVPPGGALGGQLRRAGLRRRLVLMTIAHVVQYLLWIGSWWLVGRGALQGRADPGWLAAWALLLLTLVPLRGLVTWSQGWFTAGAGVLLQRRLLLGALRQHPDDVRHEGTGQLLGRVLESEAVGSLALGGGLAALVASTELLFAAWILALGGGGVLHLLLLAATVAATLQIATSYYRSRQRWTGTRLALTHDLVERMVGHRTRLAQQPRERWHDDEDEALVGYLADSRALDRSATRLALVPRGWLLLGIGGLAPTFIGGTATPAALAVGLGGVLLAHRSLATFVRGLAQLAGATIAWGRVGSLFHAATRPRPPGRPGLQVSAGEAGGPLLQTWDLSFRYPQRADAALEGCSLSLELGQRLLLEGASGSGKSTLASLLAGLREPSSGLLLLQGLDRHALGADGWRRRVATAPQFHENHVLTETLAFNLLLGRGWPPGPGDLEEAETVARQLGLGDLLDRMPAGLLQMVGETGWQLSHGESSRVYLARALLQDADLVILDESFVALDPENLERALRTATQRARTLLAIAHP